MQFFILLISQPLTTVHCVGHCDISYPLPLPIPASRGRRMTNNFPIVRSGVFFTTFAIESSVARDPPAIRGILE